MAQIIQQFTDHPIWILIVAVIILFLMVCLGKELDHIRTQRLRMDILHEQIMEHQSRLEHIYQQQAIATEAQRFVQRETVTAEMLANVERDSREAMQALGLAEQSHEAKTMNAWRQFNGSLQEEGVSPVSLEWYKKNMYFLVPAPPKEPIAQIPDTRRRQLDDRTDLISDSEPS
jgi:hypothetical protein